MTIKKICLDCGKQFEPKGQTNANVNGAAIVVCEDCLTLLKRIFWNSMIVIMITTTTQDRHNKDSGNE
jgi:ribosome-binding protein aMBF1 (putative translation factor)